MDIRDEDTIEVRSPIRRKRFFFVPRFSTAVIALASLLALGLLACIAAFALFPEVRAYIENIRPGPRYLTIESAPSGAEVYIAEHEDGREHFVGLTPLPRVLAQPKSCWVRLFYQGYKRWKRPVDARAEPTVAATLERDEPGKLIVTSEPEGAMLYLDDVAQRRTPLTLEHVSADRHTLRLEKDPYLSATRQIQLKAGETKSIKISLESGEELRFREDVKNAPYRLSSYTRLLRLYTNAQKAPEAVRLARDALAALGKAKDPPAELSDLALELLRIYRGEGGPVDEANKAQVLDGAFLLFEKVLHAAHGDPRKYSTLVDQLNRLGQFPRIVASCDKVAADPTIGVTALRVVAEIFEEWEKPPEVAQLLERALKIQPQDFQARFMLAKAYKNTKQPEKALTHYQLAEKLAVAGRTPRSRSLFHTDFAAFLAERGDVDAAIAQYEKAIKLSTSRGYACLWRLRLAQLLLQKNRRDEAAKQYRKIVKLYPGSKYAAQATAMLQKLGTP